MAIVHLSYQKNHHYIKMNPFFLNAVGCWSKGAFDLTNLQRAFHLHSQNEAFLAWGPSVISSTALSGTNVSN